MSIQVELKVGDYVVHSSCMCAGPITEIKRERGTNYIIQGNSHYTRKNIKLLWRGDKNIKIVRSTDV